MEIERSENDPCCYCCRRDKLNIPPRRNDEVDKIDAHGDGNEDEDDFFEETPDFVGHDIVVPAGVAEAAAAPPTVYKTKQAPVIFAPTKSRTTQASRKYDTEEGRSFAKAKASRQLSRTYRTCRQLVRATAHVSSRCFSCLTVMFTLAAENGEVFDDDLFFDTKTV